MPNPFCVARHGRLRRPSPFSGGAKRRLLQPVVRLAMVSFPYRRSLNRNSNAQEGCRNGSSILARAFVLTVEQTYQFLGQVSSSTVFFCGFKRVHRRSVKIPKGSHEICGGAGKVEDIRVSGE